MSVLQTAMLHPQANIFNTSCLFDEFYNYTSGNLMTTDTTNSGTVVASSALGVAPDSILLTTGTTIGNYVGVHSTLASFIMTSGIGMFCEEIINWTDYSSLSTDILFGFASALVTSTAGAIPTTSYSGAMIQRLAGSNVWSTQSSNGSAKTNHISTTPANGAGSYQLRVDIFNYDSLNAGVAYRVNGVNLIDNQTNLPILDKIPYASIAAMNIYSTIQTSVADAQLAYVDYITASKFRNLTYNNN